MNAAIDTAIDKVVDMDKASNFTFVKGTVQRNLTAIESDINRKVFLSH
jgi:hypothetical protein